jgi:mono/diheme cytochrome c family protein/rhodanese-related sulfurtransferase
VSARFLPNRPLRSLVCILALFALATLTSCRRVRRWMHRRGHTVAVVTLPRLDRARVAHGRELYLRYCALCHRADASGYAADHANAVGNQDFLQIASDDFLRTAIADGHPGTPMSAWAQSHGGPLDGTMVNDIVIYLRSLSRRRYLDVGSRRVNGNADTGRRVFQERCASCHGPLGGGSGVATSLSHPTFQRSASNGFIRYTIEHGRRGTPMLAFANLGAHTLDDLVAYVRTLEREPPRPAPAPVYEPPPGLDQLVINPRGRPPSFTLRDDRYVPAAEVAQALTDHRRVVILDARATSDWNRGHIPGALPFPFYNIEEMAGRLPNDGTWILAYCACPHAASGHVVDELRRRHFAHTAVIDEGIGFWQTHGFPMATATIISGAAPDASGRTPTSDK